SCDNLTRRSASGWGLGMRTGRPVAKIELSAEAAGILEGYTHRRKTAQALALRARIVLGCASGLSNKAVAARGRVTVQGVGKWRGLFVERGIEGLLDEPRPGRIRLDRPAKPSRMKAAGDPVSNLNPSDTLADGGNFTRTVGQRITPIFVGPRPP